MGPIPRDIRCQTRTRNAAGADATARQASDRDGKGSNAFISRRPGGDGMQPIADLTGVLDLALRRHEAYGFTQLLHPIYTLAAAGSIASRHSTSGRRPVIGRSSQCEWALHGPLPRQASEPNSTSTGVGVFTSVLNFSLPFDG
jgi:hypothetical protein